MTRPRNEELEGALSRASILNALGILPKLAMPLYLVAVSQRLGRAELGLYLLGLAMQEIVTGLVVSGLADATIVRASAALGREDDRSEAARVVAAALLAALGLVLVVCALELLCGVALVRLAFPGYAGLHPGLHLLALSMVPRAFTQTSVAALRASLAPEWDVIVNDLAQPLLLLGLGLLVTRGSPTSGALFGLHLGVELLLALVVLRPLVRAYGGGALARALRALPVDRELVAFAIPQATNVTLARYLMRVDALLLAHYGLPSAELARFATAALVTSNLAQIRMVLGRAAAPVIARLSALGDRAELARLFGRVTRQALIVATALCLAFVPLRADVLGLFGATRSEDARFVGWMLAGAFVGSTYGLASSLLAFTGHARANLANGLFVAVLNTAMLAWAAPRFGLTGAAAATCLALVAQTLAQHVALARLEGVRLLLRAIAAAQLGGALALALLLGLGDPSARPFPARLATGLLAPLVFLGLAFAPEGLRLASAAQSNSSKSRS